MDISSYITWIVALSTGAVAIAISQPDKLAAKGYCESALLIAAVTSLFLSIILGCFAKYQANQSVRNYRFIFAIARMQKFVFYRSELTDDPIKFGRKYHQCEYMDEEHRKMFHNFKEKNKRWYSEEHILWGQLSLFLLGYVALAILAIA